MTAVRVLRLIEYTYPDQETADTDMLYWHVPPNGAKEGGGGRMRAVSTDRDGNTTRRSRDVGHYTMRSAIISQPWPLTDDKVNSVMGATAALRPGEPVEEPKDATPAAEA